MTQPLSGIDSLLARHGIDDALKFLMKRETDVTIEFSSEPTVLPTGNIELAREKEGNRGSD